MEPHSGPRVPVSDAGSCSYTFLNPRGLGIRKYKIDGCVLTDHDPIKRCDYLLIRPDGAERFVELKGSDIKKAIEQLEITIDRYSGQDRDRIAYVVSLRVSPKMTTALDKAIVRFSKSLKTRLEFVRNNGASQI